MENSKGLKNVSNKGSKRAGRLPVSASYMTSSAMSTLSWQTQQRCFSTALPKQEMSLLLHNCVYIYIYIYIYICRHFRMGGRGGGGGGGGGELGRRRTTNVL